MNLSLRVTEPGLYIRDDYDDITAYLRKEAPLFRSEDNIWVVSRYEDVRAISRDPGRFSSAKGVLINDPLRPPETTAENVFDAGVDESLFSILHMDPPTHAQYRKTVNRDFTPKAVVRFEDDIRENIDAVLSGLPTHEEIDLVESIAAPLPIAVICKVLGMDQDAHFAKIRRWSDAAIEATDRITDTQAIDLMELSMFLLEHVSSPAAESSGVLRILKECEINGRAMTNDEMMGFCIALLVAGNETTRTTISGGLEVLAQHPDQRAELVADRSLLPDALEEILRWVTPIQAFCRTATTEVEMHGQTIRPGDYLTMLYHSANRDETVFGETAGQFDIHRPIAPTHVAFGFGEHLCLGASLARLETRMFFDEFLNRFPNYQVTGPAVRVSSTLARGISRLPVVLDPK